MNHKAITFLLIFSMLAGMFILPHGPAESAEAATATYEYVGDDTDGRILSDGYDATYSNTLSGSTLTTDTTYGNDFIGQRYVVTGGSHWHYYIYRTYFNISIAGLPPGFTATAAEFSVKTFSSQDYSTTDFGVNVAVTDWGNVLDDSDWNATRDLQGQILDTATMTLDTWYSLPINPATITGTNVQFQLYSDREGTAPTGDEFFAVYTGDSASPPTLSVTGTTGNGVLVTYNFTAPGMTNRSAIIYPAEITAHNASAEMYEYRFWSFNQTWVNWTGDANLTLVGVVPWGTVTDYGGGNWNITDLPENCLISVWVYSPLDEYTTFHIAMWSPNGYSDMPMLGYFWESWEVYYSVGNTFNATNCTQLSSPDITLPYGNYSFGVLDQFGAVMATQTAIANVAERFISIVVPAYELAFNSLSSYDAKIYIYTSSNLSATPMDFQLPAGWARFRYLRGTNYTIQVTFIGAGITSYFNRTVNESQTLRLNGTTIEELQEIADNIYAWTQVITQDWMPGLVRNETNAAYKPDGTRAGPAVDMGLYLDPYQIMWGTVDQAQTNLTAGEKTIWGGHIDTSVMVGTSVTILEDTLFISGTNTSASLMVNTSAGTNIINTTVSPAITYNLVSDYSTYKGSNLTVYSNASGLTMRRTIRFRWVGRFFWNYEATTGVLSTARAINNTLDYTIWRPRITIAFLPTINVSQNSVVIWDIQNAYYLDPTVNYQVDETGISFEFDNITAGEIRSFSIVCYEDKGVDWEQSEYGTPTIYLDNIEYAATEYADWGSMYQATGTWHNAYPAPYSADIVLVIGTDYAVRENSVIVVDSEGKTLPRTSYIPNGNIVTITKHDTIDPGTTVQYTVYFLHETDNSVEAFLGPAFLGIPFLVWLILAGLIILTIGTVTERIDGESPKTNVLQSLGAVIIICALAVTVILAVTGATRTSQDDAEVMIRAAGAIKEAFICLISG